MTPFYRLNYQTYACTWRHQKNAVPLLLLEVHYAINTFKYARFSIPSVFGGVFTVGLVICKRSTISVLWYQSKVDSRLFILIVPFQICYANVIITFAWKITICPLHQVIVATGVNNKSMMAEFHLVSRLWYCACWLTVTTYWDIWTHQIHY